MVPLPNLLAPLVDKVTGLIKRPWNSFLQQFVQPPPAFMAISVTASPFSYTVKEPGMVTITGGTVSNVALTRGTVTINFGSINLVPVGINDIVTVTYSVLPTIKFVPSYGQNTTS